MFSQYFYNRYNRYIMLRNYFSIVDLQEENLFMVIDILYVQHRF